MCVCVSEGYTIIVGYVFNIVVPAVSPVVPPPLN